MKPPKNRGGKGKPGRGPRGQTSNGGFRKGGEFGRDDRPGRDGGFNKTGRQDEGGGFRKSGFSKSGRPEQGDGFGRGGGFSKGSDQGNDRRGFNRRDGGFSKGPGQGNDRRRFNGRGGGFSKGFIRKRTERLGGGAEFAGPQAFPGVYRIAGKLATKNKYPGNRVYGEKTFNKEGAEYRLWDPNRSKVAAALAKGLRTFPIKPDSSVLYLGASSGTTASHISDIAKVVYCVEFSKRMMRELLPVCEERKNMVALLADARHPWEYSNRIGDVDVVIQDVAQPDQAGILLNNLDMFGFKNALLSIKARSINSVGDPKKVFKQEVERLRPKFDVLQEVPLEPFEEDHILVALQAK